LAVVFSAKIGLGVWELNSSTNGPDLAALWGGRDGDRLFLIAIESLLTFALVPAFIHEDPLVGSVAEWQTRPIWGARLLAAKLLGLGLVLCVMPVLIGLPWWLSCGYGRAKWRARLGRLRGCRGQSRWSRCRWRR